MALFVAALWLATYFCASMLEYQEVASLWYPPAAVTFAAFAVFRRGAWPGVFLANAVATMLMYRHVGMDIVWYRQLTVTLLFTLAHCLPYWLCAEAVLQSIPRNTAPSLARTVGIFLLAGIFAALIAACPPVRCSRWCCVTWPRGCACRCRTGYTRSTICRARRAICARSR